MLLLLLLLLLPLLLLARASLQANLTVDDADLRVIYQPPASWRASSVACTACLNPASPAISAGTFHDGTGGLHDRESDGADDDHDVEPDLLSNPTTTAQVLFTGTAVYVFCIVPDGADGEHIVKSNLTFFVDDQPLGTYQRFPANSGLSFLFNQPVFALQGLDDRQHTLVIAAQPDSALLLDYILFTTSGDDGQSTPPPVAEDAQTKHHNNVSFAVAVGASVGTLSLISSTLCLSLYCRRRRSRQRQRAEQRRLQEQNPPMIGPMPFTPRFFPRRANDDDGASSSSSGSRGPASSSTLSTAAAEHTSEVARAAVFVPRYFPGTPIPPPSPPTPPPPPSASPLPAASIPRPIPIPPPGLETLGTAVQTPLPPLSEADETALAYATETMPPAGEDPPPFDPVRLPSYETALSAGPGDHDQQQPPR